MKRILILFTFIAICLNTYSQSVTPKIGNTRGRAGVYVPTTSVQFITDAASATDTVMISPKADQNFLIINTGDTLKGCVCIGLKDSTALGKTKYFTDDGCNAGDELKLIFNTTGLKLDTIKFYGNIECDSSGSGSNQILSIKKDLTKKTYVVRFIFDGTKYKQESAGNAGLGR